MTNETQTEKGCGKVIIKVGQGTNICGWRTGINKDKGIILCDECKLKQRGKEE